MDVLCSVPGAVVVAMLAPWEAPSRLPDPARAEWPKTVAQYAVFIGKSVWTVHKRIRLKLLDCEMRDGQDAFITQAQHERYANGRSGLLRERKRS